MANLFLSHPYKGITQSDLELYYTLNEEAKAVKKKLDAIKSKIKKVMLEDAIDTIEDGEYSVVITDSKRKDVDEEMLVDVLNKRGLFNAIQVTRVPIESQVMMCISKGLLPSDEYDACVSITTTKNITVKHI